MAEYRAGRAGKAIAWLTGARPMRVGGAYAATADFYLATAHHKARQADHARATLARARETVRKKVPAAGTDDLMAHTIEDWLICKLAECEAKQAL